ncbi:hypothetical protein [Fredinandcohnia quinoae]|nr:hypothetical protein [Fredinandcohnia sp. SECRCQ15]
MIISIFVIIFAWEAPQLLRKKEIRELVVFSFLLLIGLALGIFSVVRAFI